MQNEEPAIPPCREHTFPSNPFTSSGLIFSSCLHATSRLQDKENGGFLADFSHRESLSKGMTPYFQLCPCVQRAWLRL